VCIEVLLPHFTNIKSNKQMFGPHSFWSFLFGVGFVFVFLFLCVLKFLLLVVLSLAFRVDSLLCYFILLPCFVVSPCFILFLHQFVDKN